MIVLFWCPDCRALRKPTDVVFADGAVSTLVTPRCAQCSQPVMFRGIPDDPDDPPYGLPRCPTCRGDVRVSSRFCPECGTALPRIEEAPDRLTAKSQPAVEHGEALRYNGAQR